MKKYLLFMVLVCLLGNRALAQTKSYSSQEVTEVIDFSGFNRSWTGDNPSEINWADNRNYITGVTQNGEKRSFVSQLDKIYFLSVDQSNKGKWQIGHITQNDPSTSYLENNTAGVSLYFHGIKVGDKVKVWLKGSCTMGSNNTNIDQGTTLSGEVEFHMVNNTIINNEGMIILTFPNQYSGIRRIEIQTTKPYFNYDPGYEVYDFFQIGAGKNKAYTNCSANDAAGFKLNGNDAFYLSLPGTDLSLNDRIAVCQKSGWSIARGIRAPGYSDGNSTWYNVSICNLYAGDRVEVFYTGDAPTFSSNGQNGGYNGSNAFKDVKNDGEYNSDEGDQLIYAGKSLEGENSRNEGNLTQDEGTTVLLYKSFAYVMTEDGHLDLGLKNGNHTRILKVKIYSDHQARMVDKSDDNYRSATAYFDITGELQAKEHIMPGGLEVRVGNEDKTQHAIVVASRRGPVSYVNAVDGFKLPGITKNGGDIQIKLNLDEEVPTTGTFYKFIALNSGHLKVRFNASSVNYYRYDLTGDAVYFDEGIDDHRPWLALYDRANEQTLDKECPYYVMVSTDNGATSTGAAAVWGGGSSSGSGSSSGGGEGDINMQTGDILYLNQINGDDSDEVTFHISNANGNQIGGLSSATSNHWESPTYPFTNNYPNQSSWDETYTVAQIRNMANGTDGVMLCQCYNATISVTLPSSTGSGTSSSSGTNASTSRSKLYGNGADGEFEIDVEAGKTYFFYGGWSGNNYVISPHESTEGKDACGVAELLDVTFTPDRDIHPLAKWVPSGTPSDEDLADVIGYTTNDLTIKKMSGSITDCTPEIKMVNGKLKLTIKDITFEDGKNPGGVILIKVGSPTEKDDPVYVYTVAYDANYHSTSDVPEAQRGHTWDFSSTSLHGLEWDGTPKAAAETDYGTYFNDYFATGENSGVNGYIDDNGEPHGSLLYKEMNYTVDNVPRSDWMFNYRTQSGSNNYDPRFLNKYDIEGDNADMIWTTEGLIIKASSNQSCMFNEFKGTDIHASAKDPDRYVGVLSGGSFLIPHLNKDDRVIIYMGSGTDTGVEPEDMKFHISNARDALHNEISEDDVYVAGGSQWKGKNGDNNYRGCYHFFAKADGDMTFKLEGSNSICKIYKIQIYTGDRIITNDVIGATTNDKFLLTSTDKDPNDASSASSVGASSNWKLKYLGKDQQLANGSGVNSQDNEIIAKTGKYNSTTPALTDNHEDPEDNTSKVESFTYQHSLGEIGTFRVRGKDMEKNMNYVADYADHNVTIAYQQTQKYPYTWDFKDMTGFGEQDFKDEDAIEPTMPSWFNNENAWRKSYEKTSEDLSLWETQTEEGGYYLRLNSQTEPNTKDNIFETAQEFGGNQLWANGQVVPETQGLWFYTNNNNQRNGGLWIVSNDGMELNGNNNWPYKLVVPNVPANAAVYLRMRTDNDYPHFEYLFDGGNTSCEVYQPTDPVEGNEYIFAIMNKGSKRNLTLSFGGYQLKKLAVSTDKKTVNKLGYATESRNKEIDPELMGYMTGTGLKAYTVTNVTYGENAGDIPSITLTSIPSTNVMGEAEDGDHKGYIIYNTDAAVIPEGATEGTKAVNILGGGFHLFVPDMHDKSTASDHKKSILETENGENYLRSHANGGDISQFEGDYTNYLMNYKYIGSDGKQYEGPEAFYRAGSGATLGENKAYLQLLTAKVKPTTANLSKSFSIIFEDEFNSINPGITTIIDNASSNENVNENNAEWYNINGQKLNGKPTASGLYIVNGKKVLVK